VTPDRVVVTAFAVLFIAAIAADVFDVERAPSATECAEDWNDRADLREQATVVAGGFAAAEVRGFLAKRTYPGCGVVFAHEPKEPWLSCTRTFDAADSRLTEWSCEGGKRWGRGRSRGSAFNPNASVSPTGDLVVATAVPRAGEDSNLRPAA
jgi:hypothetical protein